MYVGSEDFFQGCCARRWGLYVTGCNWWAVSADVHSVQLPLDILSLVFEDPFPPLVEAIEALASRRLLLSRVRERVAGQIGEE